MDDEIRITVIATGFEHGMPHMRPMVQRGTRAVPTGNPVREAPSTRSTEQVAAAQAPLSAESDRFRIDNLEIPTFLRKNRN